MEKKIYETIDNNLDRFDRIAFFIAKGSGILAFPVSIFYLRAIVHFFLWSWEIFEIHSDLIKNIYELNQEPNIIIKIISTFWLLLMALPLLSVSAFGLVGAVVLDSAIRLINKGSKK